MYLQTKKSLHWFPKWKQDGALCIISLKENDMQVSGLRQEISRENWQCFLMLQTEILIKHKIWEYVTIEWQLSKFWLFCLLEKWRHFTNQWTEINWERLVKGNNFFFNWLELTLQKEKCWIVDINNILDPTDLLPMLGGSGEYILDVWVRSGFGESHQSDA